MTASGAAAKIFVSAAMVAGLFGGLVASTAAPALAYSAGAARSCGFWKEPRTGWAWYTHCLGGGPVTRVQIKIDTYRGPGSYACVGPGDHGLGPGSIVRNAYYTGHLC